MKYFCAAAVFLFLAINASATPVTFLFSGTITGISDSSGVFIPTFQVGEAYSGSLTYNVRTPDSYQDALPGVYPQIANYGSDSDFIFDIKVGSHDFNAGYLPSDGLNAYGNGQINIVGQVPPPDFLVSSSFVSQGPMDLILIGGFNGQVNDAFSPSSVNLPASSLTIDLSNYSQRPKQERLTFNITSLAVPVPAPTVPEPAPVLAMASGTGLVLLFRKLKA